MKLRVRDVISHQGRDFTVEGLLTYKVGTKGFKLARALDGAEVLYVEALTDDMDDRLLLLHEVTDLQVGTPPPPTISYRNGSYLPRFSGQATVGIEGTVPGRIAGTCELWRYRAAGDLFVHIERWPGASVVLAGESVHKDMVEVFPAP